MSAHITYAFVIYCSKQKGGRKDAELCADTFFSSGTAGNGTDTVCVWNQRREWNRAGRKGTNGYGLHGL